MDSDHKFHKQKQSFDGHIDTRSAPITVFGGGNHVTNRCCSQSCVWKKKVENFALPYWEHHVLHHNLDVMHIEKNVVDNIIGTLLNLDGKTKDNLKARHDIKDMGIRNERHLEKVENDQTRIPHACYHILLVKRMVFCKF